MSGFGGEFSPIGRSMCYTELNGGDLCLAGAWVAVVLVLVLALSLVPPRCFFSFFFLSWLGFICCLLLVVYCQPRLPIVTTPTESGDLAVGDAARLLLVVRGRKSFRIMRLYPGVGV